MSKQIRILILEDTPTDAELNERELRKAHIPFLARVAKNREDYIQALTDFQPEVILSDYGLPQFTGLDALRLLREYRLETPFILVTGSLTEEVAVECMREGADDYILKTSLKRLPSAVLNVVEKREANEAKAKAMDALRRSEEQYRSVVNSLKEVVFQTDAAGVWTFLNPAWTEITGFTVEESIGRKVLDFVHPDDRQRNVEFFRPLIEGKKDFCRHEIRYVTREGGFGWIEVHARLMLDDRGQAVGTAGTLNDVTEHRMSDEALKAQQSFLRQVIDATPNLIYVKDWDGKFMLVNQALADLYNTTPEELLGKTDADFNANDEQVKKFLQDDREVMESLEQRFIHEEPVVDMKSGEVRWFQVIKLPLVLPDRKGRQVLGVANDITERKRTEEALLDSEEQLRHAQKMEAVGRLAGGIAHDFNNMLTVINGYSDLLLQSLNDGGENRKKVEEIKKAGERAGALTRQLLAFSRKQVLQPKPLDFNVVVSEMHKMLLRLIGEDIELETLSDPMLWQAKADPSQVEQVLLNLVINARDAMPHGGKITIELANIYLDEPSSKRRGDAQPGSYVMLAVSDTGCGMSGETQKRVFEPFFTTKEPGKGTGMGLSTVYGIVKQSGGNIWVKSDLGNGTRFEIYLPRNDESGHSAEAVERQLALPKGFETILVVEDEMTVRELVRDILEAEGYKVLVASGGREALDLNSRHAEPIHLLMTDVVMPQMSGREVAEAVTRRRPEIKVLYMSGYTDDAILRHGVLDAEVSLLEKPFTLWGLTRKVREALDARPGGCEIPGDQSEGGEREAGHTNNAPSH